MPLSLSFLKKKPSVPATQRVSTLVSQGMAEPEIIKTLKTEGYKPADVETALKEAVKTAAAPMQPAAPMAPPRGAMPEEAEAPLEPPLEREGPPPSPFELPGMPPPEEGLEEEAPMPPGGGWRPPGEEIEELRPIPTPRRAREEGGGAMKRRDMEEIAEAVVEEKWKAFDKEVEGVHKKMEDFALKMSTLESVVNEIKSMKKTEVDEIKTSMDAQRDSIVEMTEKLEAMENAMKNSLTPMMQSLRALTETVSIAKRPEA